MTAEQLINIALIIQFVILTAVYIYLGNWNKVMYWAGAALITYSIYEMV